ncbi:ABC transporter permease [Cellulomonas shaoxiangyii]|uniref:Transport permease protein n=1 Tax=Cellulomonas shaoxiangyii TaxID=2566013 RepID=A0A4P7SL88_9CELL|nr:ABC transporter permease [Cellulomonas shaoxiangyii]QCB94990.1 ABC transporter permease [Cellulomonas shaoxiangyii]TGY85277.1 ABC transporter permease [Cellulomonas shaoxiangyii]
MTVPTAALPTATTARSVEPRPPALARPAGFWRDVVSVAGRSLRQARREPAEFVAPLFIPVFFFAVFVGSLEDMLGGAGVEDFRAFQLPVSIVVATTGLTRATALVHDITTGYFDRMLMAPVNRLALLLGFMVTDLVMVLLMSLPVLALGFAVGVEFTTGVLGMLAFVGVAAAWALGYVGWLYAVALRTGNPTVTAQAFLLFFPFVFLTTTIVPQERMTDWLAAVADVNPLTHVFAALRSLVTDGWDGTLLLRAFVAIGIVAVITHTMALLALRGRVARGRA